MKTYATLESQLADTQKVLALAEDDVARLRSCLAWYADVSNYDEVFAPGTLDPQQGTWHIDGGDRAREALASYRRARDKART